MRKYLFAVLAALAAGVTLAFTPVAYTNSYVKDGVTYSQRGGLGTSNYVAVAVNALENNYTALTNNANFKAAVETVSPPAELPEKWALANVTNKTGGAVCAADVGAVQSSLVYTNEWAYQVVKTNTFEMTEAGFKWRLLPSWTPSGSYTEYFTFNKDEGLSFTVNKEYLGFSPQALYTKSGAEILFPSASGTFALTSDLPTIPNKWALANVTNATGGAVTATDVGAFKSSDTSKKYTISAGDDGSLCWTSTSEDGVSLYLSNPLYPKSYGSMWIGGDASVTVCDDDGDGASLYNNGTISFFTNNSATAWNIQMPRKSGTAVLVEDLPSMDVGGIASQTHRLDAELNYYGASTNYLPWVVSAVGIQDTTLYWDSESDAWTDDDDTYWLKYNKSTGYWEFDTNGTAYPEFCSFSQDAVMLAGWADKYYRFERDSKKYEVSLTEKIGEVALKGSYVPTNRTVNGKSLSSDITLTAADVSAVASNSSIRIEAGSTGVFLCNDGVYGAINRGANYYETYTLDQTGLTIQVPPAIGGYRPLPIFRGIRDALSGEVIGGNLTTNRSSGIFGTTDNRETHYGIGFIGVADAIATNTYYKITIPSKNGTMALDSDLTGYVPTTRKVNGQALTQDITIEGMTDNAVVWTNSTLKTKAGATVSAMDYQAMTNTVNEVKAKFYDEPLQTEWTVRMVNGDMKLYATTNVNTSVLN